MTSASDVSARSRRRPFTAAAAPWWLLCGGLGLLSALSGLVFGFDLPYWRHADQDLVLAYHGLLLNQGLPQEYFDHPGYTYFLVIAEWYRLLHALGLLPVATLSALPPVADTAAYNEAWQSLIEAGRALSIVLCASFVMMVATLIRLLFDDRRIGFLAGLAFAFAVGITTQARQMRTDLPSAWLAAAALLLVLLAVRRAPGAGPLGMLAAAAACAALAVVSKVQAIFPVMAIPVLAVAFARPVTAGPSAYTAGPRGWIVAAALAAAAAAVVLPAAGLVLHGLAGAAGSVYPYTPIGGGLSGGPYQGVILGWGALGVLAAAAAMRAPAPYAAQALAAVAGGAALGILALLLRWHEQNAIAVANLVEHMFVFSSWRHGAVLGGSERVLSGSLMTLLLEGAWRTFAIRTVVLHPDNIPQTLLLEWFAIAAGVVAWRRGERAVPLRIALLLAVAWSLETLFALRGFQRAYAVYTDPLVVLAAAAALARFPGLMTEPRRRRWLAGALALYVALAHVWPVVAERRRVDPAQHCGWIPTYMPRVAPFPFCGR